MFIFPIIVELCFWQQVTIYFTYVCYILWFINECIIEHNKKVWNITYWLINYSFIHLDHFSMDRFISKWTKKMKKMIDNTHITLNIYPCIDRRYIFFNLRLLSLLTTFFSYMFHTKWKERSECIWDNRHGNFNRTWFFWNLRLKVNTELIYVTCQICKFAIFTSMTFSFNVIWL